MGQSSFRLVLRADTPGARAFAVPPEGVLRLGSGRGCHIVIEGPDVLPSHCFLRAAGGRLAVLVQEEKAQVLVNGQPERKKILAAGDVLEIAGTRIRVEAVERDPLLGSTLAGYRLESRLGRGASGTVYLATQLSLDRKVALKLLSPELTRDEAFVARFLEEAKAAAKLNHPNVVQVYDAGTAPAPEGAEGSSPVYFFSMEYLAGGTLQQVLDRDGKIPLERALAVGCDAARALAWAAEQGIVHRDIKPANLLFAHDGSAKVADMGIAADVDRMMEGVEGLSGAGSPRYMAPEQALRRGVDHRADIYALGCTLVRAVSGRHVFDEKSSAEVLKAKTTRDAPPVASLAPELPPALAALFDRMLARDMTQRPRTCAEVLEILEQTRVSLQQPAARKKVLRRAAVAVEHSREHEEPEATSPWGEFLRSTAGRVNLSVSALLVFCAVMYATTAGSGRHGPPGHPPPPPRAVGDVVTADTEPGANTAPTDTDPGTTADPAPAASTAVDVKAAAEQSRILTEFRGGLTDGPRAIAALEDFKRKYPTWADRADASAAQIRSNLEAAGRETLKKVLENEVRPALERGAFQEALQKLTQVTGRLPFNKQEVSDEIRKVEEAAAAALTTAEQAATKAAGNGDFDEALSLLRQVERNLTLSLKDRLAAAVARLEQGKRDFGASSAKLESHAGAIARAIVALDFAAAAREADGISTAGNPLLEQRKVRLKAQCERGKWAWQTLSAAAARSGRPATPELLRRPASELAALLADPSSEAQEALGLLLLAAQGPAAARPFLLPQGISEEVRHANLALLGLYEKPFLTARSAELEARVKSALALPAGPERTAQWERLLVEAGETLTRNRELASFAEFRKPIAEAFVRAHMEKARAALPEGLFRGRVKSYKPDGAVEVVYEFLSPEELRDFVPVKGTLSPAEIDEGMGKMRGEYRFKHGEVFRGRIGVTLKLPNQGYSPAQPNINVALWTTDKDVVTRYAQRDDGKSDPDRTDRPAGGAAADYLAFGTGYQAKLPDNRTSLSVLGTGPQIAMPLHTLLGGVRGKPLHSLADDDCYFTEAAAGKVKGALTLRVTMAAGAITWTLNGRQIPIRNAKGLEAFKRPEPLVGSLTLFTNGEMNFFQSIAIDGDLNPAWIDARLRDAAEKELKKREAG